MNKEYVFEIDEGLCKGCGICLEVCPKNCLEVSDERNEKGILLVKFVESRECIGCEQCELFCPELAIQVRRRKLGDKR